VLQVLPSGHGPIMASLLGLYQHILDVSKNFQSGTGKKICGLFWKCDTGFCAI